MSLTAKDVAEISRLLEDSSFTELNLELDGLKLTLRRGTPSPDPQPAIPSSSTAARPIATRAGDGEGTIAKGSASAKGSDQDHLVVAPLLGTFYRAPKPGSPPFVQVGSLVEEQTIVAIIEVMKLMNTVRAGAKGRISEILGIDGELVEFGQALLRIDQSP